LAVVDRCEVDSFQASLKRGYYVASFLGGKRTLLNLWEELREGGQEFWVKRIGWRKE